jgi:hypothetical protein
LSLDVIEHEIILMLKANGRATTASIARAIGVPEPTVRRKLNRKRRHHARYHAPPAPASYTSFTTWIHQQPVENKKPSANLAMLAEKLGVRTIQVTDKNRPDILNIKEGGPVVRYDRTLTLAQDGEGAFVVAQTVRDDKGSFRLDANTKLFGLLTGYYFLDDYTLDNPYPGQQGGANVPGFDAETIGRAQLWSFGSARTFGQNTVNDFHVSLTHNHNNVGVPHGGTDVKIAQQGFVTGPGTPGIVVLAPQFDGVENLVFNTFTMGVTITGVNQTGDTLHLSDSITRVVGSHTIKYGGQYQFQQVRLEPNATFNGTFTFAGTETGSDFADFLIGAPSNYIQSSGGVFYLRNQYGGVFAQDSWRAKSNLTINYGVRWDIMAPWYERNNQIQTIVPGQQSAVRRVRAAAAGDLDEAFRQWDLVFNNEFPAR